jgi:hypothetical protein
VKPNTRKIDGWYAKETRVEIEQMEAYVTVEAVIHIPKDAKLATDRFGKVSSYEWRGHQYKFWLSVEKQDGEIEEYTDLVNSSDLEAHGIEITDYKKTEIEVQG